MRTLAPPEQVRLIALLQEEAHRSPPTPDQLAADWVTLVRWTAELCPRPPEPRELPLRSRTGAPRGRL